MKIKLLNSIQEIPAKLWNHLANGRSCTLSREFWKVIEQSDLNDFSYRHILFFDDNDQPIGFTSFYSTTTDIAVFTLTGIRSLLEKICSFFPNFLKVTTLECSTPITINSPKTSLKSSIVSPCTLNTKSSFSSKKELAN